LIPSSNLLNQAFSVIGKFPFKWFADSGRTLNAIGEWETDFAEPVELMGSIQAVNRSVYQAYGLDFQKNYVQIFVSTDLIDLSRDFTGDQIEWQNRRFQLTSNFDWFGIDGWVQVMAIDLGQAGQFV